MKFYYNMKPCKKCGGTNIQTNSILRGTPEIKYVTRCMDCMYATEEFDTPEKSAKAWQNDREN
jgi:hypothetical protein